MNINEMIEILQAYKEGENIQAKYKGGSSFWGVIDNPPTWNFEEYDFRVKPEPREFYVNLYGGSDIHISLTEDDAEKGKTGMSGRVRTDVETIRVREVLDNE